MIYAILTPYNNEQSDLINRISQDKKLEELPVFQYTFISLSFHLLFYFLSFL